MIDIKDALKAVLETRVTFGEEIIDFQLSTGRVIAENINAGRDFPPFNRVAMDGIAIDYNQFQNGQKFFPVEGVQAAGQRTMTLSSPKNCVEIMTGACMVRNATTVVRYEDLRKEGNGFYIESEISDNANIHFKGSDLAKGALLVEKGKVIRSPEIAILAAEGKSKVCVSKLPKIVIVSSGNELVDTDSNPEDFQIRKSNSFMIESALKKWGIKSHLVHLQDDKKEIVDKLRTLVLNYDVILMSGGVSKGKFDFIPEALIQVGINKLFHKVAQRPGKPFWFGKNEHTTVFAFPGNPTSTLVCFKKYFEPWLRQSLNINPEKPLKVYLEKDFSFLPNLTFFGQGKFVGQKSERTVRLIKGNGSGDMTSLLEADGFVELPKCKSDFTTDEEFDFFPI